MGTVYRETDCRGEESLIYDILFQPEIKKRFSWCATRERCEDWLDQARRGLTGASSVFEIYMAYVKNLERSNKPGEDFANHADCKMVNITYTKNGTANGEQRYAYTSVIKGVDKNGALYVRLHVELAGGKCHTRYYEIPREAVQHLSCAGKGTNIRISWNTKKKMVEKLEPYKVVSYHQRKLGLR